MRPTKETVEQRALRAAEWALGDHLYVSPIDVLIGMRMLEPSHVKAWQQGRLATLLEMIQGKPEKVLKALNAFVAWAEAKGLKPVETPYTRRSRDGVVNLRFMPVDDDERERFFHLHWMSPELSPRQTAKLKEKAAKDPQPVVFEILRDSQCSECGAELERGSFLTMDAEQALCLPCAGLGGLEYLPRGDTALTRRTTKYSSMTAVVVRFSRSRGRYERQGLLAEPAAIEKAEAECADDAEERARTRARTAEQRHTEDRALASRMAARILELFPRCPPAEARAIATHAAERNSGRVGRTAAARKLEERPLTAAVAAAIRHRHTNYEQLLMEGVERGLARETVAELVQEKLASWR